MIIENVLSMIIRDIQFTAEHPTKSVKGNKSDLLSQEKCKMEILPTQGVVQDTLGSSVVDTAFYRAKYTTGQIYSNLSRILGMRVILQ